MTHKDYLKTDHWLELRKHRLEIAKNACERPKCGCQKQLNVHHWKYRDSWFDTQVDDLRVLCRWCHASLHGKQLPTQRKPNARHRRKPAFLRKKNHHKLSNRIRESNAAWKSRFSHIYGRVDSQPTSHT